MDAGSIEDEPGLREWSASGDTTLSTRPSSFPADTLHPERTREAEESVVR